MGFKFNPLTGQLDIVNDPSADTLHVLKAGDTMTGTLVVPSLNVNGSSPVTRITVDSANAFSTGLDIVKRGNAGGTGLQTLSGSEIGYHSFYGYTGSAIRRLAYAIVYASGDTTSTTGGGRYLINVRDTAGTEATRFYLDQTGLTIGSTSTIAPTHTLTLPSTATGIALYNTADQTTNYERGVIAWSSSVLTISTEKGGTGTGRQIRLRTPTNTFDIREANNSANGVFQTFSQITTGSTFILGGQVNGSSSVMKHMDLSTTIGQSGTAGYTMLLINPTESTVGSGVKLLLDAQVGGTSLFRIDNAGKLIGGSGSNRWTIDQFGSFASGSPATVFTDGSQAARFSISTVAANLPGMIIRGISAQTAALQIWQNSAGTALSQMAANGVFFPVQAPTASAPTYVEGGMYYDTTLHKMRIGGAAGWETITSV